MISCNESLTTHPKWNAWRHTAAAGELVESIQTVKGKIMLGTILVVLLVLMLLGALPTWGHSKNWGYAPTGGLGLVLILVIILVLLGRI